MSLDAMEILIPIAIYAALGVTGLGLAILLYMRSVSHRRWYECPSCGEKLRVELMRAGNCNTCGAPLQQTQGD